MAGDEVYGANPGLRAELEARGVGYVLAVACDHRVPTGGATHCADALLKWVSARAWQQVSCGKGAKGHRCYLHDKAGYLANQAQRLSEIAREAYDAPRRPCVQAARAAVAWCGRHYRAARLLHPDQPRGRR